jgi:hypothetical protein
MTGFEVAGVVLGALPLIVSTIENYERIIGPVITYHKYSEELEVFSTELGSQKDIFQNECLLLLRELVNVQELEDMLEEPSHALWNTLRDNLALSQEFSRKLGRSNRQILRELRWIGTTLDQIYEETKDLGAGLSRPERAKVKITPGSYDRLPSLTLRPCRQSRSILKLGVDISNRNSSSVLVNLRLTES